MSGSTVVVATSYVRRFLYCVIKEGIKRSPFKHSPFWTVLLGAAPHDGFTGQLTFAAHKFNVDTNINIYLPPARGKCFCWLPSQADIYAQQRHVPCPLIHSLLACAAVLESFDTTTPQIVEEHDSTNYSCISSLKGAIIVGRYPRCSIGSVLFVLLFPNRPSNRPTRPNL